MPECIDDVDASGEVSAAQFKAAMRHVASTVNVITSHHDGVFNGMTATAMCSVSTDPPSVLIVVNREARSHGLIDRSGVYTVNVLSAAQHGLAVHFAAAPTMPFADVSYSVGRNGCPIIDQCAAFLACSVESRIAFGTHTVFIGRVVASGEHGDLPLIYHDGNFRSLKSSL
jgi:flavin reductase